jgi:uncharacterized protein YegP (UPF0339 family)
LRCGPLAGRKQAGNFSKTTQQLKENIVMAGKFDLKKSKSDQFYFSLLADNGQSILQSEMYETKASAQNGIESVKKNSGDDARYNRLTAKDGSPYFTLKAGNHQVIGQSQMYSSESARDNAIELCKTNGPDAAVNDLTV